MPKITSIIFDLGGVIINLDTQKSFKSLLRLSPLDERSALKVFEESEYFQDYEKGLITDQDFRFFLRDTFQINSPDLDIDYAWNAMLLDIPITRLDLLKKLNEKYELFLLSNTNSIHLKRVIEICDVLDSYFSKAYYSHNMGKRKPDLEIFEQVIAENNLNPANTLFLDDSPANIAGAARAGLQARLVADPDRLTELIYE